MLNTGILKNLFIYFLNFFGLNAIIDDIKSYLSFVAQI